MNKRHRTFIAINLPSDIKKRLAGFEKKYADVPAKWTPVENLHITLLFLGDLTDQDLAETCRVVKEIAERTNTFNVNLDKVAYGPEKKIPSPLSGPDETLSVSPRYIWAGGEVSREATQLKKELEDALYESVKFKVDKNPFNSHITLARIQEMAWRQIEPEERPEVGEELDSIFTVESIEVMESELTRQGPRYEVIESHQLQ